MNFEIETDKPGTELLTVRTYPDPALEGKSAPIERVTDEIRELASRMVETMRASPIGIGLAASQVGVKKQLIVIDPSLKGREPGKAPLVLVNPKIMEAGGESFDEEGCLSLPGMYAKLTRSKWIKVEYTDLDGGACVIESEDYMARLLAHEMDHLDGVLFWDRMWLIPRLWLKLRYFLRRNT